jgi:hypothetical protein
MAIRIKSKIIILALVGLLVLIGSINAAFMAAPVKKSSTTISSTSKNPVITEKYAINKIKQLDKNVRRLIPCNKRNTVENIVNKYSKNYFMFLANYGTGEEEYTSEKLYLVNKKTGILYTLMVNGNPIPVTDSQ